MFGQSAKRWLQGAVVALAGAALTVGMAGPAAAAPATGVPERVADSRVTLRFTGVKNGASFDQRTTTSQLALQVQGRTVPVYCIDFHTAVKIGGTYQEDVWTESRVRNLAKVQWVLAHSYPNVPAAEIVRAANVTVPSGISGAALNNLLYFGAQTAIWELSDGVRLADRNHQDLLASSQYSFVQGIRNYLIANATDQPEPQPTLSIDPGTASATAGDKAGPFTVTGPAGEITLTVNGGTAVDAVGAPVTTVANGGQFWLTRGEPGGVTVTAEASGSLSYGRVFLYTGGADTAQKLILGSTVGSKVKAEASATFTTAPVETPSPSAPVETPSPSAPVETPSPSTPVESPSESPSAPVVPSESPQAGGDLPLTGAATAGIALAGLALLAAGVVAVVMVRRRRMTFTA